MRRIPLTLLFAAACLASHAAQAERIKVLTTGAFKAVAVALIPDYERRSGHSVDLESDTAGALVRRLEGGESFDVVILSAGGLEAMVRSGRVDAPSAAPLATVGVGVAVKAGKKPPPIGTVDEFRQALLDAGHVAFVDPASGGTSGAYLVKLFERLGIAEPMARKSVLVQGGLSATKLVSGEADLALQQVSELNHVPGTTYVGPLPDEIQSYTTYSGGIGSNTPHRAAAVSFMSALTGPASGSVIQQKGMSAGARTAP